MNWEERSAKQTAREVLLDSLWFDQPIKYLGLPAARAIFEKELVRRVNVDRMYLYERDPEIMEALKVGSMVDSSEYGLTPKTFIEADVDDSLTATFCSGKDVSDIDLIWLDYCGQITSNRLMLLQKITADMKSESIVAATFMAGREHKDVRSLMVGAKEDSRFEDLVLSSTYLNRIRTVIRAVDVNNEFFDILVKPYKDGVPMMLFIFKKKSQKDGPALKKTYIQVSSTEPYVPGTAAVGMNNSVIIDGHEYLTVKAASSALGIPIYTIYYRIKSSNYDYKYKER